MKDSALAEKDKNRRTYMMTTEIIIGILVAAVLLVFLEMYRELHTFCVTHYQVTSPKIAGKQTWVFLIRSMAKIIVN